MLIRSFTPKRLTAAIVTLVAKSGNKLMRRRNHRTLSADRNQESSQLIDDGGGRMKLNRRTTTITLETERLLGHTAREKHFSLVCRMWRPREFIFTTACSFSPPIPHKGKRAAIKHQWVCKGATCNDEQQSPRSRSFF